MKYYSRYFQSATLVSSASQRAKLELQGFHVSSCDMDAAELPALVINYVACFSPGQCKPTLSALQLEIRLRCAPSFFVLLSLSLLFHERL